MRMLRICAALMIVSFGSLASAAAEDVLGNWRDAKSGAVCAIYNCAGGICVKVLRPATEFAKDTKNPDLALRDRPMAGVEIVRGAKKSDAKTWKGQLYNSEDGGTYSGSITLISKDELQLQGCVLGGLICQTRVWKRAS